MEKASIKKMQWRFIVVKINKDIINDLVNSAIQAKQNAYNPYSHFSVGSAILSSDGTIFAGANIENASYGATVCAERVALFKAVSEGHKNFTHLAVACSNKEFPLPCGMCLQTLSEFCNDMDIVLINNKGNLSHTTLRKLLPSAFCFSNSESL